MKDLFDQFKDNLERQPEPPFEDRLWKKLEQDLDLLGKML